MILGIVASSIDKGGSFDTDYQAILTEATTQGYTLPSAGQQTIQNQLVLDLKSNGIWAEYDALWIPANDGSDEFGRLNWKAPTTFRLTKTGTVTWTSNVGYQGDGSTGYMNTGWDANTNSSNYAYNDSRADLWVAEMHPDLGTNANFYLYGGFGYGGDSNLLMYHQDTNNDRLYADAQAAGPNYPGVNNGSDDYLGLLSNIMKDDATNEHRLYKGTTLHMDVAETAQAFDHSYDVYIGGGNYRNSLLDPSEVEWGWFALGSSMIAKQSTINTLIDDYMTDIVA